MVVPIVAILPLLLLAASAFAQSGITVPTREEDQLTEAAVVLPAYPKSENLLRFPTNWTNHEIFLDRTTLTSADGIVRFTLLVRSPSSAESISYEGIRCQTGEKRVYAFGRKSAAGGEWSPARNSAWRPIPDGRVNRYYFEFWRDVFCDHKIAEERATILGHIAKGGRERRESLPNE